MMILLREHIAHIAFNSLIIHVDLLPIVCEEI